MKFVNMLQKLRNSLADLSAIFTILTFLGITTASSLITYILDINFLDSYSNLKYIITFLTTFLIFTLCFYLFSISKRHLSEAQLNKRFLEKPHSINLLENQFDKKIIKFDDLWLPHRFIIKGKRFVNCRFDGPMTVTFVNGCNLDKCKFISSNFVRVKNEKRNLPLYGIVFFEDCYFNDCEFDHAVLFMHDRLLEAMSGFIDRNHIIE